MSIATELQNYNDGLLDAYTAVNTQGGTVPANKNLDNLPAAITSIPTGGGGGGVEEKDINFYDYDGTLVDSWSLAELPDKTELPANPTHTGLTAQGWNWTLADLKTQNTAMDVGQMYAPTDGKTHIFVYVDKGHLSPHIYIRANSDVTSAAIEWGDGTSTSLEPDGQYHDITHTYSQAGDYEVKIGATGGNLQLYEPNSSSGSSRLWCASTSGYSKEYGYNNQVKKVYLADNFRGSKIFYKLSNLECVTIPQTWSAYGEYPFGYCLSLRSITIPKAQTSFSGFMFASCLNLETACVPKETTTLTYGVFLNCQHLKRIILASPTSFNGVSQMFYLCSSLESVIAPNAILSNSSNGLFQHCHMLREFTIKEYTSTNIASEMFSECWNFITGDVYNIPSGIATFDSYAFQGNGAVCIKFPNTVTTIGYGAFMAASSLENGARSFDFTSLDHIPALSSTAAFPTTGGLVIMVPASLETAWKGETNWSTYANYIVGV